MKWCSFAAPPPPLPLLSLPGREVCPPHVTTHDTRAGGWGGAWRPENLFRRLERCPPAAGTPPSVAPSGTRAIHPQEKARMSEAEAGGGGVGGAQRQRSVTPSRVIPPKRHNTRHAEQQGRVAGEAGPSAAAAGAAEPVAAAAGPLLAVSPWVAPWVLDADRVRARMFYSLRALRGQLGQPARAGRVGGKPHRTPLTLKSHSQPSGRPRSPSRSRLCWTSCTHAPRSSG